MKIKLLGYRRDNLDPRDYFYNASRVSLKLTPTDLRKVNPSVIDQGNLGSCTACASVSLVNFVRKKLNYTLIDPSVLFTYYTTREIEKTVLEDAGATMRNSIKSTVNYGITPESLHPYLEENLALKPSSQAYQEALKHQTLAYYRINNARLSNLQKCLAEGYPFVFGFAVYDNFWTDALSSGARINLPGKNNYFCGGHAVIAEGWETFKNRVWFIVKNSWGTSWGDNGYFRIPSSYLTNTRLSTDFWTIRSIEN